MRYKFLGTLMLMGGCLIGTSGLHATNRCRKDKSMQKNTYRNRKSDVRSMNAMGQGPGYENRELKPAFSSPARINPKCGWDVNISASFIYWYTAQEGMEIGHRRKGVSTPEDSFNLALCCPLALI